MSDEWIQNYASLINKLYEKKIVRRSINVYIRYLRCIMYMQRQIVCELWEKNTLKHMPHVSVMPVGIHVCILYHDTCIFYGNMQSPCIVSSYDTCIFNGNMQGPWLYWYSSNHSLVMDRTIIHSWKSRPSKNFENVKMKNEKFLTEHDVHVKILRF